MSFHNIDAGYNPLLAIVLVLKKMSFHNHPLGKVVYLPIVLVLKKMSFHNSEPRMLVERELY